MNRSFFQLILGPIVVPLVAHLGACKGPGMHGGSQDVAKSRGSNGAGEGNDITPLDSAGTKARAEKGDELSSPSAVPELPSTSRNDIALVPIAISASLESNSGKNYVFIADRSDDKVRIACRSARIVPDDPLGPNQRLKMPCALIVQEAAGGSWIPKEVHAENVRWHFTLKECPQASSYGTNLFPRDVRHNYLVTPATQVDMTWADADSCVDRRASISLSVEGPGGESKVYSATLKVYNNSLPLEPPQDEYVTAAVDFDLTNLNYFSEKNHFDLPLTFFNVEPESPLDGPSIRCGEAKKEISGYENGLDPEPTYTAICAPQVYETGSWRPWMPDFASTINQHWLAQLTECKGVEMSATFWKGSHAVKISSDIRKLRTCALSGTSSLSFFVKNRSTAYFLKFSGKLKISEL